MTRLRVQERASARLDEIYRYTLAEWGQRQAENYIRGMFESFEKVLAGNTLSRPIPAEFGVSGFFYRFEKHFIYWKRLANGDIGIVTILHERMHQIERFREEFEA